MNTALIFAGGTGQRMNTKTRPKQFLELHNKPIIIYTIETFESHPQIDAIVVVCLQDWIPFLRRQLAHYGIEKVVDVVPGGATGQESIRHGLDALALHCGDEPVVVLVHDGVRPLVSAQNITECLESVQRHGSAVTVVPAIETIVQEDGGRVTNVIDRNACRLAKAPQGFWLGELLDAHRRAEDEGLGDFIDSASMMRHFGHELHCVPGESENIKITTPADFYIFRALVDARENTQIFGL